MYILNIEILNVYTNQSIKLIIIKNMENKFIFTGVAGIHRMKKGKSLILHESV